tara:strand:- start:15 stop:257 length:243 start_codon:yes stop_codon:yes gene_type:complete
MKHKDYPRVYVVARDNNIGKTLHNENEKEMQFDSKLEAELFVIANGYARPSEIKEHAFAYPEDGKWVNILVIEQSQSEVN